METRNSVFLVAAALLASGQLSANVRHHHSCNSGIENPSIFKGANTRANAEAEFKKFYPEVTPDSLFHGNHNGYKNWVFVFNIKSTPKTCVLRGTKGNKA